ncbi:flagellar hook basal-body protein [Thermostilla marina]
MPYGLYLSAEGAAAQSRRLDVIAHNLANVDTVGFKRELAIQRARLAEAQAEGEDYLGSGSINDVGGGVLMFETKTDFAQGPIKETGVETDFAIRGEGFFLVEKEGETFLTRAGNFFINGNGELVTQFGNDHYRVLSADGNAIVIDPINNGPWELLPDGTIQQPGQRQRLALVEPTSYDSLRRVGENLFQALDGYEELPADRRNVVAGHLEMSGVQPTAEMVDMITTSRLLEANLNMMQTQDQMLSGLFNRVMRV